MILFSVLFRVLIAICTQSYFQPDEYFQALEPAHKFVFGYGHLTWEWLSPEPVRSMLYPAINVPVYLLLKIASLDRYPSLVVAGPRVVHGLIAALTDIWVWKLANVVFEGTGNKGGTEPVFISYILSITSFFHSLSLSRSLSNSLETSLTTIALAYFPWDVIDSSSSLVDVQKLRRSIIFAGMACATRPTNAIIWIYMFSLLLWRVRGNGKLLGSILRSCAYIGLTVILALFVLDTLLYGRPTLTLLNFLLVNASPISSFYGASPWHYYVSQGLPVLCATALPFVLHGFWLAFTQHVSKLRTMAGCIGWTLLAFSFIGHKEWRFLHPLLPMMHILAAKSIIHLIPGLKGRQVKRPSRAPLTLAKSCWSLLRSQPIIPLFLFLSIPASVYVVFFHCTGQIKVMSFLEELPIENTTIGFLMPCHSTPWQAYLHRPDLARAGRIWALGCEPPLGLRDYAAYKDQTDVFFESPILYMQTHFPARVDITFPPSPFPSSVPNATFIETLKTVELQSGSWDLGWRHEWPRYIVCFGVLLEDPAVRSLFEHNGYAQVWKGGWEWEGEGKRKGGVRVLAHGIRITS